MLTLNEIRNVNFRKSNFGGYRAEDVEAFIDEVQLSYDTLLRENAELVKKLEVLASKLEEYQNEEDSIRNALMNAQKVGDASLRDAKHKAEIILKDATIKAEKIVSNAQAEIHHERDIIERMQRDIAEFKTKLLRAYKDHLTLINNLPNDDIMRPETKEMVDSVQMLDRRAVAQEYDEPRQQMPAPRQQMPQQKRMPAEPQMADIVNEPRAEASEPAAPAAPVMPVAEKPVSRKGGFTVNITQDDQAQRPQRRPRFSKAAEPNPADSLDMSFDDLGSAEPEAAAPPVTPASLFRRRGDNA